MKHIALLVLAWSLAACTASATTGPTRARPDPSYQPPPPPPPRPVEPPPMVWDPSGWTLLGSQTVDGQKDKDVFAVGKNGGRFDKLMVVVQDSDLEIIDFVVFLDGGTKFEPKVQHKFREGTRTRAIDLPGNDRVIQKINVRYSNLPGGGKARVEIYGKDSRGGGAALPPPPPAAWDPAGWTLLGSQTVEGQKDKDVFAVGKNGGKFDRIMVVVKDSDLELVDFVVFLDGGTKFEPKVQHKFREGARTRAIDLPGNDRVIQKINVRYSNLPGGGKARVEIYGMDTRNKR